MHSLRRVYSPLMKADPILPSSDLAKTKRFYGRLGFQVRSQGDGERALLVMERAEIVIHFYFDEKLQPIKNHLFAQVATKDVTALAKELQLLFRPEDSGLEGWLLPVKGDEIHLVDPDGNLLMIRGLR